MYAATWTTFWAKARTFKTFKNFLGPTPTPTPLTKKLNKTFLYFWQNSLRRNRMLEQPLLFTGSLNIQFFNSFLVTYGTPCHASGQHFHLIFCDLETPYCTKSHYCRLNLCLFHYTMPRCKCPKDVPLPTFLAYLQPD